MRKKKDPHWLAPSSQSHMKVCVMLDAKNLPGCRFSFLKIVALFYTCTADLNLYERAPDGGACENPNAGNRWIHTLIEKLWYAVRFAHSATSSYEMEDFQSGIVE